LTFSQENINISIRKKVIPARVTNFNRNGKNKYLKVDISGICINDSVKQENMKLLIYSVNKGQILFHLLYKGNKLLDDEIPKTNSTKEKYDPIWTLNKRQVLQATFPLRVRTDDLYSTYGYGYDLSKGNYNIFVEYKVNNKTYRSNNLDIKVK